MVGWAGKLLKIGIQLFSVCDRMKKDPVGAIREIAGLGYRYIEPANHNATEDFGVGFGITADEMLQVLKDTGTRVVGSHIFPFREENAARVLAFNKKIGNPYVVYPQEMYRSKEQIEEVCAFFNQMGRLCKESYSHDGFTEVGTGEMDIQKIIDTANGLGSVEYMILSRILQSGIRWRAHERSLYISMHKATGREAWQSRRSRWSKNIPVHLGFRSC